MKKTASNCRHMEEDQEIPTGIHHLALQKNGDSMQVPIPGSPFIRFPNLDSFTVLRITHGEDQDAHKLGTE